MINASYRKIPLTQHQFAIVDASDYFHLRWFKWHAVWSPLTRSYYAARSDNGRRIWMHRVILGLAPEDNRRSDHIETGNTLDNRRSNLRIATPAQNTANSRLNRDSRSGLKGVTWHKGQQLYHARIRVNGNLIHLGQFDDKNEAHSAYCEAAKKYYGEFARFA